MQIAEAEVSQLGPGCFDKMTAEFEWNVTSE